MRTFILVAPTQVCRTIPFRRLLCPGSIAALAATAVSLVLAVSACTRGGVSNSKLQALSDPETKTVNNRAVEVRDPEGKRLAKSQRRVLSGWKIVKGQDERIAGTPDLMQTSPELNLPAGGRYYCAPVALSNALAYLSKRGYARLVPANIGSTDGQAQLISKLGELMMKDGNTTANDLLLSVRNYVRAQGYEIQSLKYEGFEKVDCEFCDEHRRPDMNCIEKALDDPETVAILTVGFYIYVRETDSYVLLEEHDVTLLAYCRPEGQAAAGEHVLVIHDPSPRSGRQESDDFVRAVPIKHGCLLRDRTPLAGVYKLSGGLSVPKHATCALLEGVAVLKLKPPNFRSGN
jgi:hypothetical protein